MVSRVYPVGPAAEAGIRPGMRLVAGNGEADTDLVALTFRILDATEAGHVDLRIEGEEAPRVVRVPFAELPTEKLSWERLGIRCVEISQELAERTPYLERQGVLISEVREDGPGQRVGLQRGDLLTHLGSRRLRSLENYLVGLQEIQDQAQLEIRLIRPERTRHGLRLDPWKARLVPD